MFDYVGYAFIQNGQSCSNFLDFSGGHSPSTRIPLGAHASWKKEGKLC
jgi:hypothetical protein